MTDKAASDVTTPAALREWREAERVVAVARRGTLAARTAASAAEEAAKAAMATATASKAALEAATLAEASAAKTASAAKLMVEATLVDVVDSEAASALADVDEVAARTRYRDAVGRATRPGK